MPSSSQLTLIVLAVILTLVVLSYTTATTTAEGYKWVTNAPRTGSRNSRGSNSRGSNSRGSFRVVQDARGVQDARVKQPASPRREQRRERRRDPVSHASPVSDLYDKDDRREWTPYGRWKTYINNYYPAVYEGVGYAPYLYPESGMYPYGNYGYTYLDAYDPYNYTNVVYPDPVNVCYARITVTDAFGPYAQAIGVQQWLDWASRNGFPQVFLPRASVMHNHAIVQYSGTCQYQATAPPNPKVYKAFTAPPVVF